jgi:ABC-type transport system involved in multi-copper enzyme maturation permease subunit
MKAILLIAANYIREQRWVVLSLALYPPAMLVFLRILEPQLNVSDLHGFLQQQASFAVLFAIVFAAAAINQDRRSRRILGILSKSVRRSQYIAGLLLGVWGFVAIYVASGLITLALISANAIGYGVRLIVPAYIAAMAASAVTMFFTTFLPPFFATLVAGIFLGLPAILEMFHIRYADYIMPTFVLMRDLAVGQDQPLQPEFLLLATGHAIFFWIMASLVFSWRDIAVPIE